MQLTYTVYAINQTTFFAYEWLRLWFGIAESCAIKRFMPLTDMQLTGVVSLWFCYRSVLHYGSVVLMP